MPGWEYCVLIIESERGLLVSHKSAEQSGELIALRDAGDFEVKVSSTIAELGADGWELVNAETVVGIGDEKSNWYFKRRLDDARD